MDVTSSEIYAKTEAWAEKTKQRVLDNLNRRIYIAQNYVINAIDYKIEVTDTTVQVTFTFGKEKGRIYATRQGGKLFAKQTKKAFEKLLTIYDPLAKKEKIYLSNKDRNKVGLGFLRRANIYAKIQTLYTEELIGEVLSDIQNRAAKVVLEGL